MEIFVIFSTVELEVVKNAQSGENSIMYPFSYYSWQLKVAQRKTIQRKENRTVKTRGNYHFTTCQNGYQEKFTNIKCWWGCREKRTLVHWWWECKLVQPFESNMQVPQKNKNRTTIWSTPGYTSRKKKKKKKTLTPTDTCTPMFTVICSNPTTVLMLLWFLKVSLALL